MLNTFDEPTRAAAQENLVEFGNALAGRGPDLNAALGPPARVLELLRAGDARTSRSPQTGLGRFFPALGATAAEVAPVAETQAQMFVSLDTTFGALADVARPFIQETISEAPADRATRDPDPAADPAASRQLAACSPTCEPGSRRCSRTRRRSPPRSRPGRRSCKRSDELNRQLAPTASRCCACNNDPARAPGSPPRRRPPTMLGPALRFIAPAQTVCNYARSC